VAGEAELELVDRSPSAPPCRENPLIAALAASGVRAVEPKQAWTDVARFASLGVPAANFGPGVQAQAHQKKRNGPCSRSSTKAATFSGAGSARIGHAP
jgi:succinyl-diaminopimelate desuccinylase